MEIEVTPTSCATLAEGLEAGSSSWADAGAATKTTSAESRHPRATFFIGLTSSFRNRSMGGAKAGGVYRRDSRSPNDSGEPPDTPVTEVFPPYPGKTKLPGEDSA